MNNRSSGHKGISRIDQPAKRTFGWYVRVSYKGRRCAKFFNDEKYGGYERALEKALEFRNKAEADFGKPRTERAVVCNNPRNRTGVIGIQRKVRTNVKKNGEISYHNFYEVTWCPAPKVIKRTTISIDQLGEKDAFWKALKIRQQAEREIYGYPIDFEVE